MMFIKGTCQHICIRDILSLVIHINKLLVILKTLTVFSPEILSQVDKNITKMKLINYIPG